MVVGILTAAVLIWGAFGMLLAPIYGSPSPPRRKPATPPEPRK